MTQRSFWSVEGNLPRFPSLTKDLTVDVVVVGAGLTGITAAYLLKKAGLSVALLERDRCGGVDTPHTTAHLTYVSDLRLTRLVKTFGREVASAVWEAQRSAIGQIQATVQELAIDCDFTLVPGFLHAPIDRADSETGDDLFSEARLAQELGFDATYLSSVPFMERPGVRFANQAKFHPLKYLSNILSHLSDKKSQVFEGTEVEAIVENPLAVKANGHRISCGLVVLATHVPLSGTAGFVNAALFQSKLASYSSYVLGASLPKYTLPEALYWDTSDPYYYLRVDRYQDQDLIIFGGEDHKTGQEGDTQAPFQRLEKVLAGLLPEARVDFRWSGQVVETSDGLPFIGEIAHRQFVATGFGGNGMSFGTLAAMMACDTALQQKSRWQNYFSPDRKNVFGGAWNYVKENADYPYYMIKDRLASPEVKSIDSVKPGEGKVLNLEGKRVAAYRDPRGTVTTLSAVCPHMGCIVKWNAAETTWDCPCHGSRFQSTGEVLSGPAESPLHLVHPVEAAK